MIEMEKEYYGYIYRVTVKNSNSHLNGCTYIGQHKYNEIDNDYYGSSSRLKSEYFPYYGHEGIIMECIDWGESKEMLNELEKYYILKEQELMGELCLNIAEGGNGGNCVGNLNEEERNAWINKLRNYNNKKYENQNERDKISILTKEALNKPETRAKHLAAIKKFNEENKDKVTEVLNKARSMRWEDENQHEKMSERMHHKFEDQNERDKKSKLFKDMKWYNNGKINKRFKEKPEDKEWFEGRIENEDKIHYSLWNNGKIQALYFTQPGPEWVKGRLYYEIPKEWEWYNNGLFNIRYFECPEGFKKGKLGTRRLQNNYKKYKKEHPEFIKIGK